VRIVMDVSPLSFTTRSGTGTYLLELMRHLPGATPRDEFVWFYSSWWPSRGHPPREIRDTPGLFVPQLPLHALRLTGQYFNYPSVSSLTGSADLFHANAVWFLPLGNARAVVTIHDLTTLLMPEMHLRSSVHAFDNLLRFARERASGVIVVSAFTRDELLAFAPELEGRIRVIPLAPSPAFRPSTDAVALRSTLSRMGLTVGDYFLFCGTVEPRKNVPRLLRAFAELPTTRDRRHKLVIAGPPGWSRVPVHEEAARLGIGDRIVLTGSLPQETIRTLMCGALAFVYPSLYEGFGLPPLEAMACGTPVITSKVSSLPEVVGNAALLVDPFRVNEIADAMLRLEQDMGLRDDLRARGAARASDFSWARTAAETADFYHWAHANARL
jgi:glycosyltransferase involved in cell wall biosynthesis